MDSKGLDDAGNLADLTDECDKVVAHVLDEGSSDGISVFLEVGGDELEISVFHGKLDGFSQQRKQIHFSKQHKWVMRFLQHLNHRQQRVYPSQRVAVTTDYFAQLLHDSKGRISRSKRRYMFRFYISAR